MNNSVFEWIELTTVEMRVVAMKGVPGRGDRGSGEGERDLGGLREQHCCSRNPLVCELIREQA